MDAKDIAPLLGVLLPAIAALFMYRSAEREREKKLEKAAAAGPLSIGGALADTGAIETLSSILMQLCSAFTRYLAIMEEERSDEDRGEAAQRRRFDRLLDEMIAMRRSIEELSANCGTPTPPRRRPGPRASYSSDPADPS